MQGWYTTWNKDATFRTKILYHLFLEGMCTPWKREQKSWQQPTLFLPTWTRRQRPRPFVLRSWSFLSWLVINCMQHFLVLSLALEATLRHWGNIYKLYRLKARPSEIWIYTLPEFWLRAVMFLQIYTIVCTEIRIHQTSAWTGPRTCCTNSLHERKLVQFTGSRLKSEK